MPNDNELEFSSSLASEITPRNTPSDDEDFRNQLKKLELGENQRKYSMRWIVAAFLTGCAGLILLVFVLHLILPDSLRWLTPGEVDDIKGIALTVFGSLALSIGTLFYSKK